MYNTPPTDYEDYTRSLSVEQIKQEIADWQVNRLGKNTGMMLLKVLSSKILKSKGGSSPITLQPNWSQQYESQTDNLAMNV